MGKLAIWCLALCLVSNEALRGRGAVSRNTDASDLNEVLKLDSSTDRSFESRYAELRSKEETVTMNLDTAFEVVAKDKKATPEIMQMLQEHAGHHQHGHKHHRKLRHGKQPDGGVAANQAATAYHSGADKALETLNDMMLEAIEKIDFEVVRCDSDERTALAQLTEIRQDKILFEAMAAKAATAMNKAKGDKQKFEGLLEDSNTQFKTNKKQCNTERADIKAKLKVVTSDMAVMRKVVNMTDCGDSSSSAFLQCVDTHTGKQWTEFRPNQKLKDAIAQVQDPRLRDFLTKGQVLLESSLRSGNATCGADISAECQTAYDNAKANDAMDAFCTRCQTENGTEPLRDHCSHCCECPLSPSFSSSPNILQAEGPSWRTIGGSDPTQTTKCSLAGPNCPKIRERFTDLAGEVFDSLNELRIMLKNLNLHCETTQAAITAMIKNFEAVVIETNEKLADATKDNGMYNGQHAQKVREETDVHKEHIDVMTQCKVTIENLVSERCALRTIRGELLNMDNLPNNITDCIVGGWQQEACSVECGGGEQKLTRSTTPGWRGHKCPASEAKQTCNEDRCPVDCVMEEWSEWGSCTALCGGGIKEKVRGIKQQAITPEAVQCGELFETVPCNVQSCSENCELSDWQSWDEKCSKPCGGGEKTRVKKLVKPAFGDGTCPAFYDEQRHEIMACNTEACPGTDKAMTCTSKLDVTILIDGSASVERQGWESIKIGASELAKAFTGSQVSLSTLLFSGPTNFDDVAPCTGMIDESNPTPVQLTDTSKQCGIEWITRFSDNKTGLETAEELKKMEWPQGTTLTSLALYEASTELLHGRADANSIVIVITDGAPLSRMECSKQADALKKKARLMWVPVGDKFADDEVFRNWASTPWEQNIVRIEDINWLGMPWFVNAVMTSFCPDLFMNVWKERTRVADEGNEVFKLEKVSTVQVCKTKCDAMITCNSFTYVIRDGPGDCIGYDKVVTAKDDTHAEEPTWKTYYRAATTVAEFLMPANTMEGIALN